MKKLVLLIAAFLLFSVNNASALLFDTNGTAAGGNLVDIEQWDWAVGCAAAIDGNDPSQDDVFTLLTHASLAGINGSLQQSVLLDLSKEITFVAGFNEKVNAVALVDTNADTVADMGTTYFSLASSTTNFFEIYIDDINADNDLAGDSSAGQGYKNGTLLLSGTITSSEGNFTSTFFPNSALDQYGNNEMIGVSTVSGQGSTDLWANVDITFLNTDYFKYTNLIVESSLNIHSTTNSYLPFLEIDPANQYWDGTGYVTPAIGTVNGDIFGNGGDDVIFQTDVSSSMFATYVPEPTTIVLFGFGLLGVAGLMRREKA